METEKVVVDYHSLARRELQNLCKKHGIPANKTNAYMADALTSILKGNQQNWFGSTPEALSENKGSKSIRSKPTSTNKRGYLTVPEDAQGEASSSFETGLEGTEKLKEDTGPSVRGTYIEEHSFEEEEETRDDTTKTYQENVLQQVESSSVHDQQALCQKANQQDYFGAEIHRSFSEDAGGKSVSPGMERENQRDDSAGSEVALELTVASSGTRIEETETMEEDTGPPIKYAYVEEHTQEKKNEEMVRLEHCQLNKVVNRKCDESDRDSNKGKLVSGCEEIGTKEEFSQQGKIDTSKADEDSVICISRSPPCNEKDERDNHEAKIYNVYGERPIHIKGVEYLGENEEMMTGNGMKKRLASSSIYPVQLLSHQVITNSCNNNDTEKKSQRKYDANYVKGSLVNEVAIVDDTVNHDVVCNQPIFCNGDSKVEKSFVKTPISEVPCRSSCASFQFSVDCENGIKLSVDIKDCTPSDLLKTCNYEFSLPQDFHKHKNHGHSELELMKNPSKSEADTIMEDRETGSAKLTGLRPCISDAERLSSPNLATCSSNCLKNQDFYCSSPLMSTKTMDVVRELRRASVLIPPHGANRGLSPLLAKKPMRFLSTFSSLQKTSNVCSASAIYNSLKSGSQEVNQESYLSESTQPVMTVTSKPVTIQSRVPEKQTLLSENQPVNRTASSVDGHASSSACVEAAAVITPLKTEFDDAEMFDRQLDYSLTSTPKNETNKKQALHQEEEFYYCDKQVERISQMHCPQKEMPFTSLLENSQDENMTIASRYKDDYKKSPFTKSLRGMKSLARASVMRADILAKRRTVPVVQKNYSCSQSSSLIHGVHYTSPNVQDKHTVPSSCLSTRDEILNEIVASPQVYRERDLCSSKIIELNPKLSSRPLQAIARKRFLEKALAESTKRMQAQKMQCNATNHHLSAQKQFAENIPGNNADNGYDHRNNKNADDVYESEKTNNVSCLPDLNLSISNIFEMEDEYNKRLTECQKSHKEQYKTPLRGKSKDKALKVAKNMALVQRNGILNSKRGITSTKFSSKGN